MIFLAALLGAVTFRLRGSHLMPLGRYGAGRALWATAMALVAWWATAEPWMLATAPLFFIGCIPGWKHSLGLGRSGQTGAWLGARRVVRDWAVMAVRGVVWTAPAGLLVWWLGGPWWFALSGAACPLLYELAWRIPSRIPHLQAGPPLGEVLFGAWVGAMLALS